MRTHQLFAVFTAIVCLASGLAVAAAQSEPPRKVPIVVVVGCVGQESNETWMLTSATDAIEAGSKLPAPPTEADAANLSGQNKYRLIGISEFNLPTHKGHKERVEGLFIAAKPLSRLNVTSVKHVADTCGAPK